MAMSVINYQHGATSFAQQEGQEAAGESLAYNEVIDELHHVSEIDIVADLKRVADQAHFSLRLHNDFDNVEPVRDFLVIQQAEPFLRRPDDAVLLPKGDGLVGIAKEVGRSRFDFHKHQDFSAPITADQIDFTSRVGSEITKENFVVRLSQKADGYLLSSFSQAQVGRSRCAWEKITSKTEDRFEPPGRTFGGGDDKGHETAISPGVLACHTLCSEQIRKPETPHAS